MPKAVIRVTAGVIVDQQQIFCARKAPGKPLAGLWEFPGGKLEAHESEASCLARELKEELNLDCAIGEYFATNVHEYDDKIVELVAYWVSIRGGQLRLQDHDKACWLPVAQLMTLNWAPADIPFVEQLQAAELPAVATGFSV